MFLYSWLPASNTAWSFEFLPLKNVGSKIEKYEPSKFQINLPRLFAQVIWLSEFNWFIGKGAIIMIEQYLLGYSAKVTNRMFLKRVKAEKFGKYD